MKYQLENKNLLNYGTTHKEQTIERTSLSWIKQASSHFIKYASLILTRPLVTPECKQLPVSYSVPTFVFIVIDRLLGFADQNNRILINACRTNKYFVCPWKKKKKKSRKSFKLFVWLIKLCVFFVWPFLSYVFLLNQLTLTVNLETVVVDWLNSVVCGWPLWSTGWAFRAVLLDRLTLMVNRKTVIFDWLSSVVLWLTTVVNWSSFSSRFVRLVDLNGQPEYRYSRLVDFYGFVIDFYGQPVNHQGRPIVPRSTITVSWLTIKVDHWLTTNACL